MSTKNVKQKCNFTTESIIYKPKQINEVLTKAVNDNNLLGNNKGIYYYNVPCAFDIETTSFYRRGKTQYDYNDVIRLQKDNPKLKFEKCSLMYVWQFGINGYCVIGRYWSEFLDMMAEIVNTLQLNEKKRLIVYIHNLSYEFQFIRTMFNWHNVFSIDERKPIYAVTSNFIEFRCSYLLTGYSLAKLGEQLTRYPVKKLVGDLDYNIIRHSDTPLTEKEINYCINDIKVVMATIQEKIENEHGITRIPLTKTGYVRKHCRANCLYLKNGSKRGRNFRYLELIHNLQISGLNEFKMLQRAFNGGFTHANSNYIDAIVKNVASYDFTSSYPAVMITEKYPMSAGVIVHIKDKQEFEYYIKKYCCVFDIIFHDIMAFETQDNPLSQSSCYNIVNGVFNNGRVFSANELCTTITNIDYNIISKFYRWQSMQIGEMIIYKSDYLPTEFIKTILQLYADKTTLKGVDGKEIEYLHSKEMLNSCYGMCVTNPIRDEFIYNTKWSIKKPTVDEMEEMLYQYNNALNRFLFYPWGVFITAYARQNLFTAIYALKDDYIYSDTDSVKVVNFDEHLAYFEGYNDLVKRKLEKALKFHSLPFSLCEPTTIKGTRKLIGVWDFEGVYEEFKTLGAKRYMVRKKDILNIDGIKYDYSLTVSGLDKRNAIPYLYKKYGENIMHEFTNNLYIPTDGTGKKLHTYIDYQQSGLITDYRGVTIPFEQQSGLHLEPTDYTLNLGLLFLEFINGKKYHTL